MYYLTRVSTIIVTGIVKVTRQGIKEIKCEINHLQNKLKEFKDANKIARLKLKERKMRGK
jgi:hypothetical protein